jgi:hypothetical protein
MRRKGKVTTRRFRGGWKNDSIYRSAAKQRFRAPFLTSSNAQLLVVQLHVTVVAARRREKPVARPIVIESAAPLTFC